MPLKRKMFCALAGMFLLAGLFSSPIRANRDPQDDKGKNEKKKDGGKAKKGDSDGAKDSHPILWREPTDIERRDLFYGQGGRDGAPSPSDKFTFVRRSSSGTSEKIIVDDDKGRSWTVKFGAESKPETAASRIVWAVGYHVDQDYFVKSAHIEGRGGFDVSDVRFERRDDGFKEIGPWKWLASSFNGTRELEGLKVLMVLLNNWDLKDVNNKIVQPNKSSGGDRSDRIFYVSDLGATLGSTGSFFQKLPFLGSAPAGSKGVPDAYAKQVFIDSVNGGRVHFHYEGKNPKVLEGISVENARWIGGLLGRLSDKQLTDAFRAGGFTDNETASYVHAVRSRIDQLRALK